MFRRSSDQEEGCASSIGKVSSSPKSGAWKGLFAGGGEAAAAELGAPSGAENSEFTSMRDVPFGVEP
jgi:hypothetical protein